MTATRIIKKFTIGLAAIELAAVVSTVVHPLAPLFILLGATVSLVLIYYQQILLVMFATVSLVKGALIVQIPMFATVDYTLAMAALLVIAIARISLIPQVRSQIIINQKIIAMYMIWVIWMITCSLYAPDRPLAFEKSLRFTFFNSILFLGPLVFIRSRKDSYRILKVFIIVAVAGSVILLGQIFLQVGSQTTPGQITRLTVLSANPIAAARVLAISAGMATLALVMNPRNAWRWAIILFVCLTGAVFTGSRGPVLSYLIGTFVMSMLMGPQIRKRLGLLSLMALPVLVMIILLAPETLTSRFLSLGSMNELTVGKQGFQAINTILTRIDFWRMAIILWTQNPSNFLIGIGTAGYPVIFPWRDIAYPHNMVLEVLAEFGLVGMGVFSMHLWLLMRKASEGFRLWIKKREEVFWAVGMVIMFLASMVSGDLNDNRMLWFLMGGFLATLNLGNQTKV